MSVERAQKSEIHETTADAPDAAATGKLRPEAQSPPQGSAADELRVKDDPDESSFGGPVRIDDPSANITGSEDRP